MSIAAFDIAIGLNAETIRTGVTELHTKHHAALFTGHEEPNIGDQRGSITWDVKKPPVITLAPPTAEQWGKALDSRGKTPPPESRPTANALQTVLTSTDITASVGKAKPYRLTDRDIGVYGSVSVVDGKLEVAVLALAIDESGMGDWDKIVINNLVLPQVFKAAGNALSQLHIPTAELFGAKLEVKPAEALVTGSHLVLSGAANIDGNATPAPLPAGFAWPSDKPLWALFSRRVVTYVLNSAVNSKLDTVKGNRTDKGVIGVSVDYKLKAVDKLQLDAAKLTAASAVVDMSYVVNVSMLWTDPKKCALIGASKGM
ncbi:MAG: hypothetical protein LBV78_13480 [Kitasatospora sp.]|nr:hypothetical protein [Kitasatospora sp.]